MSAILKVVPYRDLFAGHSDVLVCPVNCQPGVMGRGLALEFAKKYTGLRARHASLCLEGKLKPGLPYFLRNTARACHESPGFFDNPDALSWDHDIKYDNIIMFPTKDHWANPSKLEWIWQGLGNIYNIMSGYNICGRVEITFPALGCGLGGLNFRYVVDVFWAWMHGLPDNFVITLIQPGKEQP